MNAQQEYVPSLDGVWEGDPGDGTDFIPVVDLPIEDGAAIPTLDIFDRPVAQAQEPVVAGERGTVTVSCAQATITTCLRPTIST